jgi:hypothetical protein
VDVGCEVAYGGGDAWVQGAAVGEMSAETHSCGANAAVAGGEGEEGINRESRVFVVGGYGLELRVLGIGIQWVHIGCNGNNAINCVAEE